jgi:hypothetical protein
MASRIVKEDTASICTVVVNVIGVTAYTTMLIVNTVIVTSHAEKMNIAFACRLMNFLKESISHILF